MNQLMEHPFYHICTDENHPDLFVSDTDFKSGINILGLCLSLYEDLSLYSFAFMSNHLHLLMLGNIGRIEDFISFYFKTMKRYFRAEGKNDSISELSASFHKVDNNDHLLNVVAYIHRNANVIDRNFTPYTYRWSSGRYYFNPEARERYLACRKRLTLGQRQQFTRSRKFDGVVNLYEVDNYVSPLSFCKIDAGEKLYVSASQYMYHLMKNVESSKSISAEIGEHISYSDYDLYPVVRKKASSLFMTEDIASLSVNQKLQMAKLLRYDYSSGNKQISRLLKVDVAVINNWFPSSGPVRR